MSKHREPKPPNSDNDAFDQLVEGLETTPSVDTQRDILVDTMRRHQDERDHAGITREIIDSLPDEIIDKDLSLVVGRKFEKEILDTRVDEVHTAYAKVFYTNERTDEDSITIPLAILDNGKLIPANGYTPLQAEMVFNQLEEIAKLRDEGVLPDLGPNLYTINSTQATVEDTSK